MFAACCQCRCSCNLVCLQCYNCWNLQLSCPVLHISLMQVVSHLPPFWLRQFILPHLLLPNTLHVLVYCLGNCAHHAVGFIIAAQLVQRCPFFIIILILPICLIIRTCKIAQTVSNTIQYLLKYVFWISGCQSHLFSISHIFLLLGNCCLYVLNNLSYLCGFFIHIFYNPFALTLGASNSVFHIISSLKASFMILFCAILWFFRPFHLRSVAYCDTLNHIAVWITFSIWCVCQPEVVNGLFLVHWPLYLLFTFLLGEVLDIAEHGPHRRKLHYLCHSWYIRSTWTWQILNFHCQ